MIKWVASYSVESLLYTEESDTDRAGRFQSICQVHSRAFGCCCQSDTTAGKHLTFLLEVRMERLMVDKHAASTLKELFTRQADEQRLVCPAVSSQQYQILFKLHLSTCSVWTCLCVCRIQHGAETKSYTHNHRKFCALPVQFLLQSADSSRAADSLTDNNV